MAKLLDTTITGVANVSSTLNVVSRIFGGSSVNVAGQINSASYSFSTGGKLVREPIALSSADAPTFNGSSLQIADTASPALHWWNSGADELWTIEAGNGRLDFSAWNNAWNDGNTWLSVFRNGPAIDAIDMFTPILYITCAATTFDGNVEILTGTVNVASTLNVTANIVSNSNVFAANVVATGTMNASVVNAATFIKTTGQIMPNVYIGSSAPPAGNVVNDIWIDTA